MSRCTMAGLLAGGLLLVTAPVSSAQTWGRLPVPSTGACFYEDVNFGGQYFCAPIGAANGRVPPGTNDRISSIRVFGNADVTVFRDNGFEGQSRRFDDDMRDLRRSGWNDRISSFRIGTRFGGGDRGGFGDRDGDSRWGRGPLPQSGACFYEDVNFRGRYFCGRLGSNTAQVPLGINDQISSVRIFGNAEITVFRDNGFEGRSRRFDDDMRDLRQAGWNDRISSFRIEPRGFGGGRDFGGGDRGGNGGGFGRGNRGGAEGGLEVFGDIGFRGRSATFSSDTPDATSSGMGGQISSLRVPPGERWQVCTETGYRGRCQVVSGDVSDLRRGDWNDVIYSARRVR